MKTAILAFLFLIFSTSLVAQNFWQQSNFPSFYDGEVTSIASKNELVLASSYQDGLAISTDTGENWFATSPTENFQPYSAVAITNSGYLFAVGGSGGYLYRSTDIGITWSQCAGIQSLYNGPDITIGNNENIYVSSYQGVHRSTDFGNTWTLQNNGLIIGGSSPFVHINSTSNGNLVAATPSGIFKSTNNADSWFTISSIGAVNVAINSLGYVYSNRYREDPYYSTDTLYRTTNNGVSWQKLDREVHSFVFINPVDQAIVLGDYSYIKHYSISTDYGITWSDFSIDGSPINMSYNENGNYFVGTNDVGILKTNTLTGSWQPSNTGFPGSVTKVSSVISNSGKISAGTSTFGLFSSIDNGNSFTKIYPGLNSINKLSVTSNGYMFAINGTIVRSTDLGINWFDYPPPGVLYDLNTFSLCTYGNVILTGGQRSMEDAELDRSSDNGDNWDEVFSINGSAYQDEYKIIDLEMNFDGAVLGCVQKRHNINPPMPTWIYSYALIRSTDFGLTWNSSDFIYDKIIDFAWNYSGVVFAITSQGSLKSTDNGLSWNYTTGILPSLDLRSFAISYDDIIYVGTGNSGVIYSDDSGNSWNLLNQGMQDTLINSIYISPDGFLFAGTEHNGVLRSINPITFVENQTGTFIQTYNLLQNYPNPFNPTTSMQFTIGSRQFVSLKVYDILGREIETLVNEEKPAGEYEVEFDGSNLPSGIYFYRLKAGEFTETRKMVLLR